MNRSTSAALLAAALLLAACGGDRAQSATPADSAAAATGPAAQTQNFPGAIGGVPARAQAGVDSSNAAMARRMSTMDSLSGEASGGTP